MVSVSVVNNKKKDNKRRKLPSGARYVTEADRERKRKKRGEGDPFRGGGSLTDEVRRKLGIGGETASERFDRAVKSRTMLSAKTEIERKKEAESRGLKYIPGEDIPSREFFKEKEKEKLIAREEAQAELKEDKLTEARAIGIEEKLGKQKELEQRGQDKLAEDILKTETELAEIRGREGVLNSIEKWRLETKLENQKEKWEKINRGEDVIVGGTFPIGINLLGLLSAGKSFEAFTRTLKNKELAQRLMKQALEQQNIIKTGIKAQKLTPQIVGGTSFNPAFNPKSQMQLGNMISNMGWKGKAAALIAGTIGYVAWGKHAKGEAVEFMPYQMSKALERGDFESYNNLRDLFKEIENPTGWANFLEEFPGINVIVGSINKVRTARATIDMLDKEAGFDEEE